MQITLAPETADWLDAQVRAGRFASVEEAVDACVSLARLREKLTVSLAEPRRLDLDDVKASLAAHFANRRTAGG
jgi:Arc/MetJ-type ribon-helix-helix transcriptional regulator